MKKVLPYIVSLLILLLSFQASFAAGKAGAWHLEKDKDEIQIYTREVPGKQLKELRVVTHFNVNAHTFIAFISDVPAQPKYLYNCLASKLLKSNSEKEHIYYQQTSLPWPCTNRDGVYRQLVQPDLKNNVVYIKIESVCKYLPEKDGFVRVPVLAATWKLNILPDNTILAEYQLSLDPGGLVPAWLVNLFIDKAPYDSFMKMKKMVHDKKYQNVLFPFLTK
ncbi:MAG: START domain-containing protein [Chitinophagales bacterium]|nr:START domain-containing protein [Chitinophagales bacterium]